MPKGSHISPLRWLFAICLLLGLAQPLATLAELPETRTAPVLTIKGVIGPAVSDYVASGIAEAHENGAPLVLVRMDTPGGLDTSMREIIRAIVNSPVPVVTYVSPSGARAASAGAYILMGSHVAAMAPGTNVGAATPVQLGGSNPFAPGEEQGKEKNEGEKSEKPKAGNASEAKAINDAVAYMRSLAEMRGRNADWAEAAVREAASLSAAAALEQDVIEIVAVDSQALLAQLDGRTVRVGANEIRLETTNLQLSEVAPNWRTRFLAAITDPNIALLLLMIGIYGLLFEFMNPGAFYPGTIGAICLFLGLYALSVLPVNYAGVALLLLGLGLMAGEAFEPSFGILGIGGVVAFALGATIMFDTDLPQFRIAVPLILAVAVAGLGATLLIVRLALKSRRSRIASGKEEMLGTVGTVLDWAGQAGHVHVHGERWNARSSRGFVAGEQVRVAAIDGLIVDVEPFSRED